MLLQHLEKKGPFASFVEDAFLTVLIQLRHQCSQNFAFASWVELNAAPLLLVCKACDTSHATCGGNMADCKAKNTGPNFIRIKLISMGEGGTGKSVLIKRFCEQTVCFLSYCRDCHTSLIPLVAVQFVSKYISTIGVDFGVKSIQMGDKEIKVNFWDLSGHPEFFEVRNEFYADSKGVCLCTSGALVPHHFGCSCCVRVQYTPLDRYLTTAFAGDSCV